MIEKRWRSVCRHEDRYAGPKHEGFRMIDLKAESAYQFYRKGEERRSFLRRPQGFFEVFGCHLDFPMFTNYLTLDCLANATRAKIPPNFIAANQQFSAHF